MPSRTSRDPWRMRALLVALAAAAALSACIKGASPVAVPGGPYSGTVGIPVQFDGSGSLDPRGEPLTYTWDFGDGGSGTGAKPSHTYATPGTFTVKLTVSDTHSSNSATTHATISAAANRPPVAVAGGPYPGTAGIAVTFDGSGSSDPDGDPLSFSWDFGDGASGTGATASHTYAAAGTFTVTLTVNDGHASSSATTSALISPPPNRPPVAAAGGPYSGTVGIAVSFDGTASSDPDGDPLTFSWDFGDGASGAGATASHTYAAQGTFTVTLTVNDGHASDSATASATISPPANRPPLAVVGGPYSGTAGAGVSFDGSGSSDPDGDALGFAWDFGDGGSATGAKPGHTYAAAGTFTVTLTVNDGRGGTNSGTTTATIAPAAIIPPDPGTVAPPRPRTTTSSVFASTQFLYSGPNPIQTGVAAGAIEVKRAAVVRGRVTDFGAAPLPGVTVAVLGHPELGQTLSRADGMFDLAVNGGGSLTLLYRKDGYPTAQRTVDVPWQDFAIAPDVALVAYDANANPVALGGPVQVARGSRITDASGIRQATLIAPPGTTATMTLADGSVAPLVSFHLRLTEYTVGPNGPQAMPAALPPTSGYTYLVEYSADEAEVAGATQVNFTPALVSYTENFLGFKVGSIVPSGDYDRRSGLWVPLPNGVVVKVLDVTGGQASLDVDGSGQPASAAALAALGIGTAELQTVATLYPAGQTLWRAPIDRFRGLR